MARLRFLLFLFLPILTLAQQTSHSFVHDGKTREYIQYIPASYSPGDTVPLLFSLHGLGDNMNNFAQVGFNQIADTANFIVVTPQALLDNFTNAASWNAGVGFSGIFLSSNHDDLGFLSNLIDTMAANYNIDLSRVYSTGFSMGGYMSNKLACTMNHRIAAIASVAGTLGNAVTCVPNRRLPIAHFHGTNDQTVQYSGNQAGNDVDELINFWTNNNSCTAPFDSVALPDVAADGYNITHFTQSSCLDNMDLELFKVYGADHEWLFEPQNDISYTKEIWKFLMRQQHPSPAGIGVDEIPANFKLAVYPNPSQGQFKLKLETSVNSTGITVFDLKGQEVLVLNGPVYNGLVINLEGLAKGNYILKLNGISGEGVKIIIE